ncbi:DUF6883 domain-containing protein [Caulobacter sp. RHG1]|uniref:DUF6883 domain-containing protein n=1 Tax=Caulobacter sp. (strain RHG1) TaxID=2545762 RepID=UPI001551ECE1|nr:DUF6883 domain-containing protein [Caulobacter sp. RHG1]NQE63419.1 hypothetical protein [Caulobacter sp. RHG1]
MSALEPTRAETWMPDPHMLRVELSKITDYLLNLDHAEGHGKAKFFRAVGFSEEATDEMVEAFRHHAANNKIVQIVEHPYGVKTIVECFMETPAGTPYCIRSVWNDHLDGKPPKLVTAVPIQPK